jgi:myo-inositol-1(or 4)-monophosphatase
MRDYREALELAENAARVAGQHLVATPLAERHIDSAIGKDIKLGADREAERIILHALRGIGYPLLSEECGLQGVIDDSPYWVVDPLDGTMNYSRGLGLECVSIALWQQDRPLLGVIYDFNRDELFAGLVGYGATRNGEVIHVSSLANRGQAILATGFPVGRDYGSESLACFIGRVRSFKKVRMLGSAALSLAWLACGRVDSYWEESINLWDVGAGLALVLAAGGWISCVPVDGFSRDVRAAANANLFAEQIV